MTASGAANKNTFWVNNSGTWVEFDHYDYFEVKKKQNQMSEFEVKIYDISTAQKAYFKEQAEVLFFAGTNMILKGRIQNIEYASAYEVIARGYGMEAKLLDKQFIKAGDNRVQYTNESAQTIGTEINGDILTTHSSGLWDTDFGDVSMRFEYANRLNALGKLSEATDYFWWVSQTSGDDYDADYLHFDSNQGETSSQKTYNLTSSMIEAKQEKDITNLVNYVHALGYGDGINQLSTSCYAASTQSSFLDANIAATNTSILVAEGSDFNATGSARIAKEIITYAGIDSNTLTGCTRGVGTTAKLHNRNCYIEQHYTTTSAQTGSSVQVYGLMDHTLIDKTIVDEETLEVIASGYLSDRKTPILRITITPDEPLADAGLNIGDNVTITDSEADIDDSYRIVGQTYRSDYGNLTLQTEVSNRSLEFIEQMQKSKQDAESMAKYMQGSTNIYALTETENCDSITPLNMRIYIPSEAVAVNKVLLNYKLKDYRTYSKSSEVNSETSAVDVDVGSFTAVSVDNTWTTLTTHTTSETDRIGEFVQFGVGTNIGTDGFFFRIYDGTNYYPNSTGIRVATNDAANGDWISPFIFCPKNVKSKTLTLQAKKGTTTSNFSGYVNYWGIATHSHDIAYEILEEDLTYTDSGNSGKYEYYTENPIGDMGLEDGIDGAQSFTVGTVGKNEYFNIKEINFRLKKTGSPSGVGTVAIREGSVSGSNLCTGSFDASTITETDYPGGWYTVTMSTTPFLTASSKYYIYFEGTAPSGAVCNNYCWT